MRYKGRNEITFSCEEKKNVTVILGDNTVGKTTIAQAFRFALYGEINMEKGKVREDYQLLNADVALSMDSNSKEPVIVELIIANGDKRYQIRREIMYIRRFPEKVLKETYRRNSVSLSENGDVFKEMEKEETEEVIQEMFPRDLSGYFLFDGEKWNTGNEKLMKENVKNSVHIMTGLSSAEKAMYHIKGMGINSALHKMKAKIKSGGIYDSIRADIDRNMLRIQSLKEKVEVDKKNIDNYENQINEIEEFLLANQSTESMQKHYKNQERLCKAKSQNLEIEYRTLVEDFSRGSYTYFALPMIKKAMELMKSIVVERKDIPYMKQATIDYLIRQGECICGAKITTTSQAYEHLMAQRKLLPPASIGLLLNEFEKTAERWKKEAVEFPEKITEHAKKLSEWQEEFEKVYNQLKKMEKEMDQNLNFSEKRTEQRRLKELRDNYISQKGSHEEAIRHLEQEMEKKERELTVMTTQNEENRKWQRRVEVTQQVYNKIESDYKKKEKEIFEELNKNIQENFSSMFNAKDKKVILDEKYGIHMMYQTTHGYLEEKNLSEGEKIARNFAFITTILQYNARRKQQNLLNKEEEFEVEMLPIVLDGPFSKLGAENIAMIAHALPEIAEQVIILMLDKDWEHTKLDEKVGRKYQIEKEKEAKSASLRRLE